MITAFLFMRYKETKGRLPFVKAKSDATHGVEHTSHSSGSSDIEGKKNSEPMESVKVVPERTVSDETR